VLSHGDPRCLL